LQFWAAAISLFLQVPHILGSGEEVGMLYAILFTDAADRAEVRGRLMPAHLGFLEQNRARIRAAGPLLEADGSGSAGGLWLVDADSAAAVTDLIQADPFWPTGLRKTVRVLRWAQVFADGRRLASD
jgi:uncharacterized protein YciI